MCAIKYLYIFLCILMPKSTGIFSRDSEYKLRPKNKIYSIAWKWVLVIKFNSGQFCVGFHADLFSNFLFIFTKGSTNCEFNRSIHKFILNLITFLDNLIVKFRFNVFIINKVLYTVIFPNWIKSTTYYPFQTIFPMLLSY